MTPRSATPTHPVEPAAPALAGLVAMLTLVSLELIRSSGPLIDTAYGEGGAFAASRAALLAYASPGLVAGLLLYLPQRFGVRQARTALISGVVLLAGLRLSVQALDGGPRFVVGLAGVSVALAVLCVAVALLAGRRDGGRITAAAVLAGAAAAVGLQLVLGTWDAYWRHTPMGWAVTAIVVSVLGLLAVLTTRDVATAPTRRARRLWALGPLLALAAMMLANPAFAAAQSGLPLGVAGPLHALGLLLASGWLVRTGDRPTGGAAARGPGLVAAAYAVVLAGLVGVALGVAGSTTLRGVLVLVALLGSQLAAARLLARALEPSSSGGLGEVDEVLVAIRRTAGQACVAGLFTIVPLLGYQLDYDLRLGFPNELVLVATAVALGVAGLRTAGDASAPARSGRPVLLAAGAVVALGTVTALAGRPAQAADGPYTGRVVSWNLHYGVTPSGSVDLEAVARTIEAQDADVVLLQEVSRGWVQGGGADMATWLSNRLGRPFAFGPAADGRFGNVILARHELSEIRVQPLPYGAGPQNRSALSAVTRVGDATMTVTSIHLQHRAVNSATRVRQVGAFLASPGVAGAGGPARLVGGDLNATPGQPEVQLLIDAGYVSAIDSAGDPTALTDPSFRPTRRIDWLFGRAVTFAEADVLPDVQLSDHLPLVAQLRP